MMTDNLWYPALNVAYHHAADFNDNPAPKKADEMMAVAMAVAGLQEIQKRQYWIQGVDDSEQSPDVRTIFAEKRREDKTFTHSQEC